MLRPGVVQVVVGLIPLRHPAMQLAPLGEQHRAVGHLAGDGVLEDMAQVRVRRLLGDQIQDGEPLQTRPEISVGKRQVGRQCSPQRLIGEATPDHRPDPQEHLLLRVEPVDA